MCERVLVVAATTYMRPERPRGKNDGATNRSGERLKSLKELS